MRPSLSCIATGTKAHFLSAFLFFKLRVDGFAMHIFGFGIQQDRVLYNLFGDFPVALGHKTFHAEGVIDPSDNANVEVTQQP